MVVKTVTTNRFECESHKSTLVLSPRAAVCRYKGPSSRPSRVAEMLGRQVYVFLALILMSVLSYYLINRFALSTVIVQGRSMAPTLEDGDRFLLNRLSYVYGTPQRGDLVVLRDPGQSDLAVKRIIAVPGEKVEIRQGAVYVNGRRLKEIYLAPGTLTPLHRGGELSMLLAMGQYFVLGDNREYSEDSRIYGPVLRDNMVGTLIH